MFQGLKVPFPEFKWRWATFAPTESLNEPRLFLGVLRALNDNDGKPPRSLSMLQSLQQISFDLAKELPQMPTLARDEERNLLRNSQQYWSALGLLATTKPVIRMTPWGKDVAEGRATSAEFAAQTVLTLELPNSRLEDKTVCQKWAENGLSIKPLKLVLSIISSLAQLGMVHAYLTTEELVRVIIPLSSIPETRLDEHVQHILAYRADDTVFGSFDDFAPGANDRRMAHEFLLFLFHHGYVKKETASKANFKQKFYSTESCLALSNELLEVASSGANIYDLPPQSDFQGELSFTVREKRQVEVLSRPGQQKFRREVLKKSRSRCILSGETLGFVLTACHIIPVEKNGSDDVGNGICLREDLHILFDSGHIRLAPDGSVHVSDLVRNTKSYSDLPKVIKLPLYVNIACIEHRWRYYS